MEAKVNIGSVTMPAGEYYVGDPCYAFSDDDNDRWIAWLEAANYDEEPSPRYLLADVEGVPVLGIGTAHGDGDYPGSDGNSYGVDAGLIGAVPVGVAQDSALDCMQKVTFESDFECSYHDGVIFIGHIRIFTDQDGDGDGGVW